MIEQISELKSGSMISIDDETSKQITGREDFVVNGIEHFIVDDIDITLVDLDQYSLVVTWFKGDAICSVCEEHTEQIAYLDEAEDFIEELEFPCGEVDIVYQKSQAVHSNDDDVPSFCEYYTSDHHMDYLLIREETDSLTVYRGFTVDPNDVIL